MPLRCTVCDHPKIVDINSAMVDLSHTIRDIAGQYGLSRSAVDRHKREHLPNVIARAAHRKAAVGDDVFMQRHEHLYAETLQYVEDAKGAVKMQRVTVEQTTPEGKTVLQERYQPFRDVGAMAPALQTAVQLQRVLGDATARFSSGQPAGQTNVLYLSVVLPRGADLATALEPVIEVQALPAADPEPES